ncbi:pyridoxal-phosphate dependent enzyme [Streptomyces eurythermus]|uniref:pyridoxal-phosphate dependent enzyme n=1 Tax=Streptomyces eurythermus TaxID=42237 RepID=UPI0036D28D95
MAVEGDGARRAGGREQPGASLWGILGDRFQQSGGRLRAVGGRADREFVDLPGAAPTPPCAPVPGRRRSADSSGRRGLEHVRTFADGIAVRTPLETLVRRARALVDEIVLVSDQAIAAAMELAARTLGVVLEPAGAAGLAAVAEGAVADDRLATVLTGANPRPEQVRELAARLTGPA